MSLEDTFAAARPAAEPDLPPLRGTVWPWIDRPRGGAPFKVSWAEAAAALPDPAAFLALVAPHLGLPTEDLARRQKSELPALILGTFRDGYRDGAHFQEAHGLALDLDNPHPDDGTPERVREVFGRWAFLAHTTASHTPEAPRWRVLLPLDRPVALPEAERLTKHWAPRFCAQHFKRHGPAFALRSAEPGEQGDAEGKILVPKKSLDVLSPVQGMFAPQPSDRYTCAVNPAPALDPAAALAELARWEQAEALPELAAADPAGEVGRSLDLDSMSLGALLPPALERMSRRRSEEERPIPVPFPALAECLGGGLWPGLSILVGNTGSGKSQLALTLALHAARAGVPTAYIGLELDELGLCARLMGLACEVYWSDLYLGKAPRYRQEGRPLAEPKALEQEALQKLAELPLFLDFAPPMGWNYTELATLAGALRKRYPDDEQAPGSRPILVILDFLQIVTGDERELRERIGKAAYAGRAIAREDAAHVLLVSSTARENYTRLSGRPPPQSRTKQENYIPPWEKGASGAAGLVGTGKESGEIEYAADLVLTLCTTPWEGDRPPEGGTRCHLAVAKQRAGGPGWVHLRFDGAAFTANDGWTPPQREKGGDREAKTKAPKPKPTHQPQQPDIFSRGTPGAGGRRMR